VPSGVLRLRIRRVKQFRIVRCRHKLIQIRLPERGRTFVFGQHLFRMFEAAPKELRWSRSGQPVRWLRVAREFLSLRRCHLFPCERSSQRSCVAGILPADRFSTQVGCASWHSRRQIQPEPYLDTLQSTVSCRHPCLQRTLRNWPAETANAPLKRSVNANAVFDHAALTRLPNQKKRCS
jgi:hypothetical protein